jgi:pimeloyl-ACP methyl ester carboxylesterase
MAMNRHQWESQLAALGGEFTAVAYDVRGHGDTGGSDRGRYDMRLYAADLHALLAALGLDRPVLCGLSMGGCIAQAYAATHPGNVAGLVLADTFAAAPRSPVERLPFLWLRLVARLDRLVRYPTLTRLQTRVADRLAPGAAGDPVTVQHVMAATPRVPHEEFRKVALSVATFPEAALDAGCVDAPTLVLYGEHAPAPMRAAHERLADSLTGTDVEVAVVPGAGHASNLDNPTFFTSELRAFARRVTAAD